MVRSKNSEGKPPDRRASDSLEPPADSGGGYCNPPAKHRWPKGVSGNPRGRPRKAEKVPFSNRVYPFRDIFLKEMERPVGIKEGGQSAQIDAFSAIVRSITVGAIQGDRHKQKMALEFASAAAQSRKDEMEADVCYVQAYKQKWKPIFALAARSAQPEPHQLPHPDHLDTDLATGKTLISGPTTPDGKERWDLLKFELRKKTKILDHLVTEARANPRKRSAAKQIAVVQQALWSLEKMVPEGWNWREKLGWEEAYAEKFMVLQKSSD